jgi:hypothetical protein
MPRPDPLTRHSARRPIAPPRVNPEMAEIALGVAGTKRNRGPRKRRPREGGSPVPADPPRGPRPMQGSAGAALQFGE